MIRPLDDVPYRAIREICVVVCDEMDRSLTRRVAPILARVAVLEQLLQAGERRPAAPRTALEQAVDQAEREYAATGNWEPWRWSEESGVPEADLRREWLHRRAQ